MVRMVQIEGGFNCVKGKCKETMGIWAHKPTLRCKGMWDQVVGGFQILMPDTAEKVDHWRRDAEQRMRVKLDEIAQ